MFDSILLQAKCPYCEAEHEIEFQTKDLDCVLEVYRKGDCIDHDKYFPNDEYCENGLMTIADCRSEKCINWRDKKDGYHSGFGRMFYAKVMLSDNIITGQFEITELIDADT